jgi:hypothetical protein
MFASGKTHFYREFPYADDLPRSYDEHWARTVEDVQPSRCWIVLLRGLRFGVGGVEGSGDDGMRPGMLQGEDSGENEGHEGAK